MKRVVTAFKIFMVLTILTGIIYPLIITGIAQVAFNQKANGSLIQVDNKLIGSSLIGQTFDSTIYFTPRPSASGYNPLVSGGSNFGLTNKNLKNRFDERNENFKAFNYLQNEVEVPSEMLFASASGLDPDISAQSARLQIDRIMKARKFNEKQKELLIAYLDSHIQYNSFFSLGEPCINVLLINIELNKIAANY